MKMQAATDDCGGGDSFRVGLRVGLARGIAGGEGDGRGGDCSGGGLRVCGVGGFDRPKVAIVATGDELAEVARFRRTGRYVDSNSYALLARVEAAGELVGGWRWLGMCARTSGRAGGAGREFEFDDFFGRGFDG